MSVRTDHYQAFEKPEVPVVYGRYRQAQPQSSRADEAIAKAQVMREMKSLKVVKCRLRIEFIGMKQLELSEKFGQSRLFSRIAGARKHFSGNLRVRSGFARQEQV